MLKGPSHECVPEIDSVVHPVAQTEAVKQYTRAQQAPHAQQQRALLLCSGAVAHSKRRRGGVKRPRDVAAGTERVDGALAAVLVERGAPLEALCARRRGEERTRKRANEARHHLVCV